MIYNLALLLHSESKDDFQKFSNFSTLHNLVDE